MHKIYELRDMLMEELEKCSSKGELSAGSLEVIDKLAHAIKSIDTIVAMEEYSEDEMSYDGSSREYGGSSREYGGSSRGSYGGSYARGRGRNARRDSMGRYSREGSYRGSYGRGGNSRGYSRDDAKEELSEQLRDIAMETDDPEMKRMVQKWIKQVEE